MIKEKINALYKKHQLQSLEKKTNYFFKNKVLLVQALTHRSYDNQFNNERLEFFGDSILNYIISDYLFKSSNLSEGQLTIQRSNLVRSKMLGTIGTQLDIPNYLILGGSAIGNSSHKNLAIIENAYEALIAAVYLDSDLVSCKDFIFRTHSKISSNFEGLINKNNQDSKSQLQLILQNKKKGIPIYKILEVTGTQNLPNYVVACEISSLQISLQGEGKSIKEGEQNVAKACIEYIESNNLFK